MPLVLGVDSSTQSCTVELRDAHDGSLVATASSPHPPTTPPVSEQDPEAWWSALRLALAEALGRSPAAASNVVAVSVDGQGHGLVGLDENGRVIRAAKLWNDTTSAPQAEALVSRLGPAQWARRTGSVPVSAFTITKVAWLAQHEPHHFALLHSMMAPHDWLTRRLCGSAVTDRSEASGSGYFSPRTDAWDTGLLDLIDDKPDWASRLPRVCGPNEQAGTLLPEVAAQLGLTAGIAVAPGAGDVHTAALGLGVEEGDLVYGLATSGVVFAISGAPVEDPTGAVDGVADATGRFLPVVCTLNAAKVTDTFARLLGVDHAELARLALSAPRRPDRPVLAAYLDGERTPNLPHSRGLLAGLSSATTREELALAAFEGVVLGLAEGQRRLESLGVATAGRLLVTGGAARSPAYRRLIADITGRTVRLADLGNASARGACVQAAAIWQGAEVRHVAQAWAPDTYPVAEPAPRPDGPAIAERYNTLAGWRGMDAGPPPEPLGEGPHTPEERTTSEPWRTP
jgi:xylulokinase